MPGKDSKYIEFTKWRNRGRGTMGEFKFKDTVENLKTNLLDNLGRWVPTAIAANGIINGIIAYILFITRGGYTKQIQLVKEYGLFGAYDEKFTTGTSQMIFKGVAGKILLILLVIDLIILLIQYFEETGIVRKVLMIIDLVVTGAVSLFFNRTVAEYVTFQLIKNTGIDISDVGMVVVGVWMGGVALFIILMVITEECRGIFGYTATALLVALIVMPLLILFLENVIPIATGIIAIAIIAIIAIATLGESVGGGTQSTSSGSAGSNTGTYSQKKYDHVKENTMSTMNNQKDNRPAYETDTNPNHHYIADYRSFGGIKLFKVHDSMGDYIMLDNSITSRKICNLKEAESGKHKFYRRENGKEINMAEIPWK